MSDEKRPHDNFRNARLAEVARRQWGCVTTAQLRRIGFSPTEIRGMEQRRLLCRMHRAVYVLGAPTPASEVRWAAGLLVVGRGGALLETSAAALHGLMEPRAVTVVGSPKQRRGDDRLVVKRRTGLATERKRGLVVTTVPQTLLDLAAAGHPIDRLTHQAAASGLIPLDALRAFAAERRGERGSRALWSALAMPHTRSNWERRFLRWLTSLDALPPPIPNDRIGRMTVDLHWPEHDLVVELDTEQTHGTAYARATDAARDAALERRGKRVLRVSEETFDPLDAERLLRGMLAGTREPATM